MAWVSQKRQSGGPLIAPLESLFLWWHRAKTRGKMQRVFSRGEDPFRYRKSPYEAARLHAMEEALLGRRWERALEVGCAEGDFTARLALAAAHVTALDISQIAIARARARLNGPAANVVFVEADLRDWHPAKAAPYGLIVLGDVLYYLDKPLLGGAFERVFPKIKDWLEPGGRLLLAHGFAGEEERAHRRGFRERFESLGLRLVSESVVADPEGGPVACLLSCLEKS